MEVFGPKERFDIHLRQENKWFLNNDFDFLQSRILHMFYNGYFTLARVQNRHSETTGKQS